MRKLAIPIMVIIFISTFWFGYQKWDKQLSKNREKAVAAEIKKGEDTEKPLNIVLLGDSNTEISYFTESNSNKKWASLISDELGAKVINLGRDGRRTSDFLESGINEEKPERRIGENWKKRNKNADYFIITFGLNDISYYGLEDFEKYTREIVNIVKKETNGEPILMTNVHVPFPDYFSWDRNPNIDKYDDVKRSIAKDMSIGIIDVNERFKKEWIENGLWDTRIRNEEIWDNKEDEGKTVDSEWFDDIHYNETGNKIVAEEVIKYFKDNVIK